MSNENAKGQEKNTAEGRNVSMYPEEWGIVEDFADSFYNGNTSAALRIIVRQWAAQQERQPVSPVPTPA